MYNFIICDDNKLFLKKVHDTILDYFDDHNIKVTPNIYSYSDYDTEFLNMVNKKISHKIYILDIDVASMSGIDMARIIRKKDYESIIIFLTGHEELGQVILKKNILPLSFINKFDDFKEKLYKALDDSRKITEKTTRINFKDRSNSYSIDLKDIIYIIRDTFERKSIIKTTYGNIPINMPLNKILELLTNDFIKISRSMIINKQNIVAKNQIKKIIYFSNGESTDLISNQFDWGLLND